MTVKTDKAQRFNDVRFVQYELTKDQAAACKAWEFSAEQAWDAITEMVEEGYSFSLKFDDFSSSYACFVNVKGPKIINKGLCLNGRGSSPFKALKQALFKHHHLMDGDWRDFAERKNAEDIDD